MTLSDLKWQRDFQRHGASRGLSATAELLAKCKLVCHWLIYWELKFFDQYLFAQHTTGEKFALALRPCCISPPNRCRNRHPVGIYWHFSKFNMAAAANLDFQFQVKWIGHVPTCSQTLVLELCTKFGSFISYWQFGLVITRWPRST